MNERKKHWGGWRGTLAYAGALVFAAAIGAAIAVFETGGSLWHAL